MFLNEQHPDIDESDYVDHDSSNIHLPKTFNRLFDPVKDYFKSEYGESKSIKRSAFGFINKKYPNLDYFEK